MLEEVFLKCVTELCAEDFSRLSFLKLAAEIAPRVQNKPGLLVLHSLYHLSHHRNFNRALQCIEHGLSLKPQDVTVTLLLAIKAAVLTQIDKHSEALHILKEAFSIASVAPFIEQQLHVRKAYPRLMAKILENLKLSRGRRQFLVFLDAVRVEAANLTGLEEVQRVASSKVAEIREQMRCGCRQESEGSQVSMPKREGASHTSIYISRLYEERKQKLGKRDNSNKKKTYDPYQWRAREREPQGDCEYM